MFYMSQSRDQFQYEMLTCTTIKLNTEFSVGDEVRRRDGDTEEIDVGPADDGTDVGPPEGDVEGTDVGWPVGDDVGAIDGA